MKKHHASNFLKIAICFASLFFSLDVAAQYRRSMPSRRTYSPPRTVTRTTTVSKSCGACHRSVWITAKVGDRCPHCHVVWGMENTKTSHQTVRSTPPPRPAKTVEPPKPTPPPVVAAPVQAKKTPLRRSLSLGRFASGVQRDFEDSDVRLVVAAHHRTSIGFSCSPKSAIGSVFWDFRYENIRARVQSPGGSDDFGKISAHEISAWLRFLMNDDDAKVKFYFSPFGASLAAGRVDWNDSFFQKNGHSIIRPSVGWGTCGFSMSIGLGRRLSLDLGTALLEKTAFRLRTRTADGQIISEKIQPSYLLLPLRLDARFRF